MLCKKDLGGGPRMATSLMTAHSLRSHIRPFLRHGVLAMLLPCHFQDLPFPVLLEFLGERSAWGPFKPCSDDKTWTRLTQFPVSSSR